MNRIYSPLSSMLRRPVTRTLRKPITDLARRLATDSVQGSHVLEPSETPETSVTESTPSTPPTEEGTTTPHLIWQLRDNVKGKQLKFQADVNEKPKYVHPAWLRDACPCDKCVDPSSGQKRFATIDIPSRPEFELTSVGEDGSITVEWKDDFLTGDTHTSKYPRRLWEPTTPWTKDTLSKLSPRFHYDDFMAGESGYHKALLTLQEYGLIFLHDVPGSETTVEELAGKLGKLQETFYGRTWDVKSKPDAENVAYTNSYLGLHQDLLYMEDVPRLQILHCLENTCTGGESIFADSRQIVKTLKALSVDSVELLQKYPVTYHYFKNGHNFTHIRPIITDDGEMRWSPPFQLPAQPVHPSSLGEQMYDRWHEAARQLKPILEDEEVVYETKLQPGECVIFDNRRILHGRRAFDEDSGSRWFKGTYVDHVAYMERLLSIDEFTLRPGWHRTSVDLIRSLAKKATATKEARLKLDGPVRQDSHDTSTPPHWKQRSPGPRQSSYDSGTKPAWKSRDRGDGQSSDDTAGTLPPWKSRSRAARGAPFDADGTAPWIQRGSRGNREGSQDRTTAPPWKQRGGFDGESSYKPRPKAPWIQRGSSMNTRDSYPASARSRGGGFRQNSRDSRPPYRKQFDSRSAPADESD